MFATPAQFTEIQKGQMDAAFALGQTFFDATERLPELNIAAAKATLEESVERPPGPAEREGRAGIPSRWIRRRRT